MSSSVCTLSGQPLVRPGYALDWYPEKVDRTEESLTRWFRSLDGRRRRHLLGYRRFMRTAETIESTMAGFQQRDEQTLALAVEHLRDALRDRGLRDDVVINGLALAGAFVHRHYGFSLHREQLFCVWLLLNGVIAEMATGEGKSITAAVSAVLAALAGMPVHVITTNDYLVERDAQKMRGLFESFGLSSDFVSPEQDDDARREAYAADI